MRFVSCFGFRYSCFTYAILAGIAMAAATFMTWATICIVFVFAAYALLQLLFDWRSGLRALAMLGLAAAVFVACNYVLYRFVGYDLVACAQSSMWADESVVASKRAHWIDVGFANLTAFLIGAGAIAVTLWLRQIGREIIAAVTRRQIDVMTLAFPAALIAIAFSRLFTLEVERIWLFLIPLLLIPATREILHIGSARPGRITLRVTVVLALLFAQTWAMEVLLYTWW